MFFRPTGCLIHRVPGVDPPLYKKPARLERPERAVRSLPTMFAPLLYLPLEVLCEVLQYVPIEDLHGSVRHVSTSFHEAVEMTLSESDMIDYINVRYGVMWTLGGYASEPLLHAREGPAYRKPHGEQRTPLQIPLIFDTAADTPFSEAGAGLYRNHERSTKGDMRTGDTRYLTYSRNVQIFFTWSIHTVYSMRVMPQPAEQGREEARSVSLCRSVDPGYAEKYSGVVDYRVLLNWIVFAQNSHAARWLIPFKCRQSPMMPTEVIC